MRVLTFLSFVIAIAFMIPIGIFYMKNKRKALSEKLKRDFEMQFKDAILASSAALQAGYSIENSFVLHYEKRNTASEKVLCDLAKMAEHIVL